MADYSSVTQNECSVQKKSIYITTLSGSGRSRALNLIIFEHYLNLLYINSNFNVL